MRFERHLVMAYRIFVSACVLMLLSVPASRAQDKVDPIVGPLPHPLAQLRVDPDWRVYAAVITHDHAALQQLLSSGDSPDGSGQSRAMPLSEASRLGDRESIGILLNAGAQIGLADRGVTPLLAAVDTRNLDLVRYLLAHGAPVDFLRPPIGESALFEAVRDQTFDILSALIENGADVNLANAAGETPLIVAATVNDTKMVQFLESHGAQFRLPVEELLYAASHGDMESVRRTLTAGADPNQSYEYGVTPLMAAAQNDQIGAMTALIHAGADVNAFDEIRATPLMYAIKSGRVAPVRALLDAGADPTLEDDGGRSTLHQAAIYLEDPDLVHLLIARGIPVDAGDNIHVKPLMDACAFGHIQTVKILLEAHVPVNAMSDEGMTALMNAALGEHTDIVSLLLEAGADPSIRDKKGKLAVDYATWVNPGDKGLIALLRKPAAQPAEPAQTSN